MRLPTPLFSLLLLLSPGILARKSPQTPPSQPDNQPEPQPVSQLPLRNSNPSSSSNNPSSSSNNPSSSSNPLTQVCTLSSSHLSPLPSSCPANNDNNNDKLCLKTTPALLFQAYLLRPPAVTVWATALGAFDAITASDESGSAHKELGTTADDANATGGVVEFGVGLGVRVGERGVVVQLGGGEPGVQLAEGEETEKGNEGTMTCTTTFTTTVKIQRTVTVSLSSVVTGLDAGASASVFSTQQEQLQEEEQEKLEASEVPARRGEGGQDGLEASQEKEEEEDSLEGLEDGEMGDLEDGEMRENTKSAGPDPADPQPKTENRPPKKRSWPKQSRKSMQKPRHLRQNLEHQKRREEKERGMEWQRQQGLYTQGGTQESIQGSEEGSTQRSEVWGTLEEAIVEVTEVQQVVTPQQGQGDTSEGGHSSEGSPEGHTSEETEQVLPSICLAHDHDDHARGHDEAETSPESIEKETPDSIDEILEGPGEEEIPPQLHRRHVRASERENTDVDGAGAVPVVEQRDIWGVGDPVMGAKRGKGSKGGVMLNVRKTADPGLGARSFG